MGEHDFADEMRDFEEWLARQSDRLARAEAEHYGAASWRAAIAIELARAAMARKRGGEMDTLGYDAEVLQLLGDFRTADRAAELARENLERLDAEGG